MENITLTQEQIDTFLEEGLLVVENVLSDEEIREAMSGLHSSLAEYGVVG